MSFVALCRYPFSLCLMLPLLLGLTACGAEPASPREGGDGVDTGGDTTPAVTPGVAGGPCYPNDSCNAGLACTGGICADPSAAAGVVGGPCYPNDTCNAGLVCLSGVCAVDTTDTGDTGVDTTDTTDTTDTGGSGDTNGSGDTGPAPDTNTPPVEETIGPAGGVIEFGDFRLTIPAGALAAETAIAISFAPDQSPAGYDLYTGVYRFAPAGTTFAIPATVSARFDGDAGRATLFWTAAGSSNVERRGGLIGSDGRLEETITHFSEGFVADGVSYTDTSDRSCVVTRLLEGRDASSAGVSGGLALFFTVDDCAGRAVTGLTASDFVLLEDGLPLSSEAQASVLPSDGRGIFVSLVLDLSSSVEPVVPELLDGARAFLDALEAARLPVQLQISAFGGGAAATVRKAYSLDIPAARLAIDQLASWRPADVGATNLHGAVVQAIGESAAAQAAFLSRNLGGAFASGHVVVFTDGTDTAGRVTLSQAQAAVSGSADEFYMVGLEGLDYNDAALTAIAPANHLFRAATEAQLAREFAALANRIAGQATRTYLLGYCSPKRAGSHEVSIQVAGAENRSTASYPFDANGFDGTCRASAFATVCEGNQCGGLGCGACDDRTTGCVTAGSSFVCEDLCTLLNECTGEPLFTDLGLPLFCAETLDRTSCGVECITTRFDVENCGDCGVRCAAGGSCADGVCACPGADGRDCSGLCRDVAADVNNCGDCGLRCGPTALGCETGLCVCRPSDGTCSTTGCASGFVVNAGVCVLDNLGIACTLDAECASGFCATGQMGTVDDRCAPTGMNYIPAGTFTMGSPPGEVGRSTSTDETQHIVTLTRSFFMAQTEVTQGQWKALSGGANPSYFQNTTCTRLSGGCASTENDNDSGPVENLDWYAAVAFANARSAAEGLPSCYSLTGCYDPTDGWKDGIHEGCIDAIFADTTCTGYRLPTESEWEYAARGYTFSATYRGYLVGDPYDCTTPQASLEGIAWYDCNAGYRTHAVGGKTANRYGLYDMLGNVFEWTGDLYSTYPGPVTDPTGDTTGYIRVSRGGDTQFGAPYARAASRFPSQPFSIFTTRGFRLARTAP